MDKTKNIHLGIIFLGVLSLIAAGYFYFSGEKDDGLFSNYFLFLNGISLTGVGLINWRKSREEK